MCLHEWKNLYFDLTFTEFVHKHLIENKSALAQKILGAEHIGSDNGLVLNRRQAITITNTDLVQRHIYVALGGDELIWCSQEKNGHHFADDIFKLLFLNNDVLVLMNISLKFKCPINNNPALVQILALCWTGNDSLSEVMMA